MDFSSKLRFRTGRDGVVELQEPSLDEHNAYLRAQYPVAQGKIVRTERPKAQVEYFDRWVRRIVNITRDGRALTLENLDEFPAFAKCAIMLEYDQRLEVQVLTGAAGEFDPELVKNSSGVSGSSMPGTETPLAVTAAGPSETIPPTPSSR